MNILTPNHADGKKALVTLDRAVEDSLDDYLGLFDPMIPDRRLRSSFHAMIKGMLAAQSTRVARIATNVPQTTKKPFYQAKRFYRFLQNTRLAAPKFLKPLYRGARQMIRGTAGEYVLVPLDFSNLEKPYAYHLEGLSLVKRSSNSKGPRRKKKDTVAGYNFLTALAFTSNGIALCYAKLISYTVPCFVSLNRYIFRAIRYAVVLACGHPVRFVCDRGFDDEKTFAFICTQDSQFVIRLRRNRNLLLADRQGLWQQELPLEQVVHDTPYHLSFPASFRVRGRLRKKTVSLGYREVHLPQYPERRFWLVVAHTPSLREDWFLLTNVPVHSDQQALQIWRDYRQRWGIESWFRFLKEEGLHIEDFQVRHLESICRLVNMTLIAALFVLNRQPHLSAEIINVLLHLGGKLGIKADKDGPYLLLSGIARVLQTIALIASLHSNPHYVPP